jgi:glutamine synthetase type III
MVIKNIKKLFVTGEDDQISDLDKLSIEFGLNNIDTVEESIQVVSDIKNITTPEQIYITNNLSDLSNSIFRIEDMKKVLPKDLPEKAKRDSVLGIMGISNLTTESIISDANNRIAVLNKTLENFSNETISIIEDSENQISQLEEQINSLKESIINRKKSQEEQEKVIEQEKNKIQSISEFIKKED